MLIEFKVTNFRSIYQEQTFSMIASTGAELASNLCTSACNNKFSLVRSAVIYGANAGGKSNFLRALLFVRSFVQSSAIESEPGEKIRVDSFAFDKQSRDQPSEFEITFIKHKIRYQFGFVADENQIFEEWLFAYPLGKAQKWFHRAYNKKDKKYDWRFSTFFKGNKQQIAELTRNNVLFLSNAAKLNNEQLAPLFEWFQKDLIFIDASNQRKLDPGHSRNIHFLKDNNDKKRILEFMLAADPSIIDINLDTKKIHGNNIQLPNKMPQEIQNYLKKEMTGKEAYKITFTHKENVSLDLSDESEGTYRQLAYAGYWMDAIDNGRILIIDELNSSLHPLVIRFLIKLICNPAINKKNAQLIFSTHDTSLLDSELFRRDQIWFVEKDEKNSTHLYPLLDFSPRKQEAIEKGYLQGRYGALPYIGEWNF